MNPHIKKALHHIEAHLKDDLRVADLAKAAGYSEYHFLRIFKQVTHLTPADYIRKRRLSEIAREIDHGLRPISDIAFEYGFNSKENFTRAFKSEHNCLPTEYKALGNSLKLFGPLQAPTAPLEVVPTIATLPGFSLTVFLKQDISIPAFWNMYNSKELSLRLARGRRVPDYGVSHWNHTKQQLDYFIGIQTAHATGNTDGTVQIEIPGGVYAVFMVPPSSHFEFVNTIHQTWQYINQVWAPPNGYTRIGSYEFETYTETSRTYSEEIYVPLTANFINHTSGPCANL